jgi:energy-coupling factor transporter transmembrane protein EcfT
MSDSSNVTKSGGIGFVGLLTIVFIALKLLGKITWSWLWVLSPLWISAIFVVCCILGAILFAHIYIVEAWNLSHF